MNLRFNAAPCQVSSSDTQESDETGDPAGLAIRQAWLACSAADFPPARPLMTLKMEHVHARYSCALSCSTVFASQCVALCVCACACALTRVRPCVRILRARACVHEYERTAIACGQRRAFRRRVSARTHRLFWAEDTSHLGRTSESARARRNLTEGSSMELSRIQSSSSWPTNVSVCARDTLLVPRAIMM